MAQYKGVQVSAELAGLLRHMDEVDEHREALQILQGAWDNLSMMGELSGMGVQIGGVRGAFGELTARLLNHLGEQALRKAGLALQARAHVAVDILVRNLFERTADIGFLATDQALRQHAEAPEDARREGEAALRQRLREYRANYSVYDDVVLLSPEGRVLARLDERFDVAGSREPWLQQALTSQAPYTERYGATDLRPGAGPALIYACPVLSADGRRPAALLALCFDLADECRRIFSALGAGEAAGDWTVVALLDAAGAVIASSDPWQLPPGAAVGLAARAEPLPAGSGAADSEAAAGAAGARVIRFGGRRWLALSCTAQPYQGYAGPGWYGHAMVPLEHAFEPAPAESDDPGHDAGGAAPQGSLQQLSASLQAALMASPKLFSAALRDIAPSAAGIEAELKRTVWNGNVALGAQPPGRDAQFSRALLREIGRTGARTREVFTRAIANMNGTVVSAVVEDSRHRAALAIDIMDRNLYERANDCRWWALTALFREALAAPVIDPATQDALTAVLQTIHGLYTVYANLLLFDRSGQVVAVSRPGAGADPGTRLSQDWVRECLASGDTRSYCVSPYEASPLYGGDLTCIYAAAVRSPRDGQAVVGGIAIVFDARPQFQAMLADSVAGDGFGVFAEPGGRVVASSRPDLAPGSCLPAELMPAQGGGAAAPAGARIVQFEQGLYALGTCSSSGYREFSPRGASAGYRHRMTALVFVPLAQSAAASAGAAALPAPLGWPAAPAHAGEQALVDLASLAVGGQWYGLRCDAVLEAVTVRRITPLARGDARLCGTVLYRGAAIAVYDLAVLLHGGACEAAQGALRTVVVLRGGEGRPPFGVMVEALGEHLHVAAARLERLDRLYPQGHAWVESLVRAPSAAEGGAGGAMLMVLSSERLAAALAGSLLPA